MDAEDFDHFKDSIERYNELTDELAREIRSDFKYALQNIFWKRKSTARKIEYTEGMGAMFITIYFKNPHYGKKPHENWIQIDPCEPTKAFYKDFPIIKELQKLLDDYHLLNDDLQTVESHVVELD